MGSSRPAAGVLFVLALFVFVFVLAGSPAEAAAEWRPSGSLGADLLIHSAAESADDTVDYGGGLLLDLWQPFPRQRLLVGFAFGLQGLGGGAADSRLFTPIAASLAVSSAPRKVGFEARLRAGIWTGATDAGFAAGGLFTLGAFMDVALDSTLSLAMGLDFWLLLGHGDTYLFAPMVALVWTLDDP